METDVTFFLHPLFYFHLNPNVRSEIPQKSTVEKDSIDGEKFQESNPMLSGFPCRFANVSIFVLGKFL